MDPAILGTDLLCLGELIQLRLLLGSSTVFSQELYAKCRVVFAEALKHSAKQTRDSLLPWNSQLQEQDTQQTDGCTRTSSMMSSDEKYNRRTKKTEQKDRR